MGKRNKFSKIGVSKKNYNALLRAKQKKNKNKNNTTVLTQVDDDSQDGSDIQIEEPSMSSVKRLNTTKLNKSLLNKSIINEEKVDKQSCLTGIDKKTLMFAMENPTRHRRKVTKVILSKGQRKRSEKKEKFKRKEILIEKIKLNNSMINCSTMNRTNLTAKSIKPIDKKDGFNLLDINNTLANVMDEIQQDEKVTSEVKFSNTHRNKRNLKKILNDEKERIKKVVENKNFQSNPLEAMKYHIKNTQLINERNKKIEENYQKSFNFLNLKK